MTDEMDLVSQLKNAEPLRPEAYERARTALRAAMAEPGSVRVLKETPVQSNAFPGARNRRRSVGTAGKVGIGAGIGVAAAAAAIALVATSGSSGTAVPATSIGAASQAPAAASPLVSLAAYIKANDHTSGDASVVIQSQKIGSRTPNVSYFVYADSGIYSAESLSGLRNAITPRNNSLDSGEAADVKVAASAANGNLASARIAMINNSQNYLGLGLSPDAQKKEWAKGYQAAKEIYKEKGVKGAPKPLNAKTAQEEADNLLWTNSFVALSVDGGNAAVREGVLRLLSTISGVSVAHTTTNGAATLTLTAGPEVFAGDGNQVLVIDAKTGALVSSVSNTSGVPQSVTTYKVYRVPLSDIKAGKLLSDIKAGGLS
jgi:hypothetical protein